MGDEHHLPELLRLPYPPLPPPPRHVNLNISSSDLPPNQLFLDLTLAGPSPFPSAFPHPYPILTPKVEPKLEPLDVDLDDIISLNPSLNFSPKSESSTPAPSSVAVEVETADEDAIPLSAAADEDVFAAIYSLQIHLRRQRLPPADALALAVVPPPAAAAWRKPQPRSSELVRVSADDPRDRQYLRDLVRRTRATYESLRTILSDYAARGAPPSPVPTGRRGRPDLDAATIMGRHGLWLNRDKRIVGTVPGILVGDIFFFRMELCVIGLHGQVQAGIDYVPPAKSTNGEPIATSIVVSGGYEDDQDAGNVIIYIGHGGRMKNVQRQAVDQKLEGGNLALERSMKYGVEIRVIRGFKYGGSPSGKVYVYDGLYKIDDCGSEPGKSGFKVFKFKLVRLPGQEELGSVILKHAEDLKDTLMKIMSMPISMPSGYLNCDISQGEEKVPVTLFNDIDQDQYPMLFKYLTAPIYLPSMALKRSWQDDGCKCVNGCGESCSCADKNGGAFAYDANGILLMGKPLIYECGSSCLCPPTCRNRVTQKGVRSRLEVFRSLETGWGVRSLDLIRAGSFICEYSGIVLAKEQAELMSMNGDSLVHPNRFPNRWYEWGDISSVLPDTPRPIYPPLPQLNFAIDVSETRNVACYLSQSCSPNVFVQFVLFDHDDPSYPHLMIFAMENIPPLRELSIDYGVEDTVIVKSLE